MPITDKIAGIKIRPVMQLRAELITRPKADKRTASFEIEARNSDWNIC